MFSLISPLLLSRSSSFYVFLANRIFLKQLLLAPSAMAVNQASSPAKQAARLLHSLNKSNRVIFMAAQVWDVLTVPPGPSA